MKKYISQISDSLALYYDGLTDRERRLINILIVSLCLLFIIFTFYLGISKISIKKKSVQKNQNILNEISTLENSYHKAKAEHERLLMRLKRNRVSLFSVIQAATKQLGLSVQNLDESKKPLGKTNITEVEVKVNLSKLSIDKLNKLIEDIEGADRNGLIKITRIKVNKRFDEPELLDAQFTVSTYISA